MAIPWLVALKVIPWGDVIEHAPRVLNAARQLLERQRARKSVPDPAVGGAAGGAAAGAAGGAVAEPPSLQALQEQMAQLQQALEQGAQTQAQLTQTLTELAEQNARLVSAVELLRLRTRLLLWGSGALLAGLLWLALRYR